MLPSGEVEQLLDDLMMQSCSVGVQDVKYGSWMDEKKS